MGENAAGSSGYASTGDTSVDAHHAGEAFTDNTGIQNAEFKIPIDVSSGGTHPAAETSDATVAGVPSGAVAGDVDTRADDGGSHSAVPGLCANGETIRSRLPSEVVPEGDTGEDNDPPGLASASSEDDSAWIEEESRGKRVWTFQQSMPGQAVTTRHRSCDTCGQIFCTKCVMVTHGFGHSARRVEQYTPRWCACKTAIYCDKVCQRANWNLHRQTCRYANWKRDKLDLAQIGATANKTVGVIHERDGESMQSVIKLHNGLLQPYARTRR